MVSIDRKCLEWVKRKTFFKKNSFEGKNSSIFSIVIKSENMLAYCYSFSCFLAHGLERTLLKQKRTVDTKKKREYIFETMPER